MNIPACYFLPPLPQGLEDLAEMALNLRWSWSHTADRLWEQIEPELWRKTANPWLMLQTVAPARLQALSADPDFRKRLNETATAFHESLTSSGWFSENYPDYPFTVAYFSMEFGLTDALPLYSGGLGILAGDYLKTASDLCMPIVGIGLLYQQGYFRQALDAQGRQLEFYPYNDPSQLPIVPVRDTAGEWVRVALEFPGRSLQLRIWEAQVGRNKLYLLDSNDPINSPADRGITSQLYPGEAEMRLQQEMVLGIGGWRLLSAAGVKANLCHLNEGHAALAVIERARSFMSVSGQPFRVALAATRPGNIFTTHTPAETSFDRFPQNMVERYLGDYARKLGIGTDGLLALGRQEPANHGEQLNMAFLAVHCSGTINAVSHLHEEVSRRIFQPLFPRLPRWEVPVTCVTNGVHTPSWDSAAADSLWHESCGKDRWLGTMSSIEANLKKLPDHVLWNFRMEETQKLIGYVRERLARQLASMGAPAKRVARCSQMLDPNVLTIGFARRFTAYKRPNLLLHDPNRLARIAGDHLRPVQLIIAGKAHPDDGEGKDMVREWSNFILRPDTRNRVIFLVDYDMELAQQLVQGVDLWINTPRRPWEACGTSGMKVLVNGGLNLSELDGWWAEAYRPDVGWALGDGKQHDDDPTWDAKEAEQLYTLLETDVIPCFYERDQNGIPQRWVARMRSSMAELTPRFSANRMIREYVERLYLKAAETYRTRSADGARQAALLSGWQESIEAHWPKLRFGKMEIQDNDEGYHNFKVAVYLDELKIDSVQVQLFAEPQDTKGPEIYPMERKEALPGAVNGYFYTARILAQRPSKHYTLRIVPAFEGASVPLEAQQVLWYW